MAAMHAGTKALSRARVVTGIGIAGAIIIAATAARGMIPGLTSERTVKALPANTQPSFDHVLAILHADPDFGSLLNWLRAEFPADYARIRSRARRELEGASTADVTKATGHFFVRHVMSDMRPLLAKAPDDALAAVARAMSDVSTRLHQGNLETCAAYARSLPDWQRLLSVAQTRSLVALAVTFLEAGASARRSPVHREAIAFSPTELKELDAALRAAGATQRTYELFASADLVNATDTDVCDFVHVLHVSRASLPAALAAKGIAQQVMQTRG